MVERLWPRGIINQELDAQAWLREVASSAELRQWFEHDPSKWSEFKRKYYAELNKESQAWQPILKVARRRNVTFLYSARDAAHNNAMALKTFLEKQRAVEKRP